MSEEFGIQMQVILSCLFISNLLDNGTFKRNIRSLIRIKKLHYNNIF